MQNLPLRQRFLSCMLLVTVIDISMAGTYFFRLWAEDSDGRDNSDMVQIVVKPATEAARERSDFTSGTDQVWSVIENNPVLAERMRQGIDSLAPRLRGDNRRNRDQ